MVLATFGVVCHAQMTPQDDRDASCEAELAKCQAVLGAVGAKKAEDAVHLAAVTAETGTPSSASEGAQIAFYPATDSPSIHGLRWQRRQHAASVREAIPCRAGSRALVSKNTSDAGQPADSMEYPESNATGCADLLRDCRAHSRARMGATSGGEPRPVAPYPYMPIRYEGRLRSSYIYVRMCQISVQIKGCVNYPCK